MGFLNKEEKQVEPEVIKEPVKEVIPEKKVEEKQVEPEVVEKPVKHRFVVVKELPTKIVREILSEDKITVLHFITIEEALTQAMNQ